MSASPQHLQHLQDNMQKKRTRTTWCKDSLRLEDTHEPECQQDGIKGKGQGPE